MRSLLAIWLGEAKAALLQGSGVYSLAHVEDEAAPRIAAALRESIMADWDVSVDIVVEDGEIKLRRL